MYGSTTPGAGVSFCSAVFLIRYEVVIKLHDQVNVVIACTSCKQDIKQSSSALSIEELMKAKTGT